MTRLTDAELAAMEAHMDKVVWKEDCCKRGCASYDDFPCDCGIRETFTLLAELKAERERCNSFEELAVRRWAWLIQHGIDADTGKEQFRTPCVPCDSFSPIAKALKETE